MSKKHFLIALGIILAIIAVLLIWAFTAGAEKTWDVCHEMTNTHVSWEQTFFPGPWEGGR